MSRWVWVSAGVLVAGLGVVFVVVGLDRADQLASVVGAVVGVVGLAVSVAGLRRGGGGSRIWVRRTGRIRGAAGRRNTGVDAPAEAAGRLDIGVADSGEIDSDGGGANTGVRLR